MAISPNPPPKKIPLLLSEVAALYTKTPPARPMNKTSVPVITLSKLVSVIIGWKKPASNAKNTIR